MNLQDEFKKSLGHFPSGVTVVTYKIGDEFGGVTVSSFTSLSLDPPLVLFSIIKNTQSHEKLSQAESYAVHILSSSQKDISNGFASAKTDKNELLRNLKPEIIEGAPVFSGAQSVLVCRKEHLYDGGDHTIFVSRVVSASTDESKSPILYFNRNYHSLGGIL